MPRLYGDLADWWPLLSDPAEYAEEAARYLAALRETAGVPVRTVLELGSGGGNNASHLSGSVDLTLVDRAPAMLAVSRRLNPGCAHVEGDMRTVRLGRRFDAVFVHDAASYLVTEDDLQRATQTAFVHCRPGGAVLFAPDFTAETYADLTDHGGHDGPDGRGLRYLEWVHSYDPASHGYVGDMAYLLRTARGVEVVHDRHEEAAWPRALWDAALAAAGFEGMRWREEPLSTGELLRVVVATRPVSGTPAH